MGFPALELRRSKFIMSHFFFIWGVWTHPLNSQDLPQIWVCPAAVIKGYMVFKQFSLALGEEIRQFGLE